MRYDWLHQAVESQSAGRQERTIDERYKFMFENERTYYVNNEQKDILRKMEADLHAAYPEGISLENYAPNCNWTGERAIFPYFFLVTQSGGPFRSPTIVNGTGKRECGNRSLGDIWMAAYTMFKAMDRIPPTLLTVALVLEKLVARGAVFADYCKDVNKRVYKITSPDGDKMHGFYMSMEPPSIRSEYDNIWGSSFVEFIKSINEKK